MLFISYSTKDRHVATELYERLVERGYYLPFLDYHPESGIPGGSDWEAELRWQIRVSQGLVVLCSKHWKESDWCADELGQARALGKEIIVLRLDDLQPPETIAARQAIDFHDRNEESYQRLWRALQENGLNPGDDFYWPREDCPYPGLAQCQEKHAAVFFGREYELNEFFQNWLKPMRETGKCRMIYVFGPSGSGKSSFVKAGILPRLKFKSKEAWRTITIFRWADLKRDGQCWEERLACDIQLLYKSHPQAPSWNSEEKSKRYVSGDDEKAIEVVAQKFVRDVKDLLAITGQPTATPLIVLDQFEELLDEGETRKEEFDSQILKVIRRRKIWKKRNFWTFFDMSLVQMIRRVGQLLRFGRTLFLRYNKISCWFHGTIRRGCFRWMC